MGKITKTMQPKHRETLSPWLKDFVQAASTTPLPELPRLLDTFPVARWPLPRGDLYHWIPLLNRFDNILECFNKVYQLHEGPQTRDFGCDVLLGRGARVEEYGSGVWDEEKLRALGYQEFGDSQLVQAVLQFTRRLLNHCGNRSIYASSSHLNDLLNSTCLSVIQDTLEVGLELAQRYQASVKRMTQPSRQVSNALLANHYNIELDRVQQIAQPFVKTPIITLSDSSAHSTPASSGKGKEKEKDKAQASAPKNAASMIANDLGSVVSSDEGSDGRWKGWGDLKVVYYPKADGEPVPQASNDRINASAPNTPTPLRRSTTIGTPHQTPRAARAVQSSDDTPSPAQHSPAPNAEGAPSSSQKSVEIPQSSVSSSSTYDLLKRIPLDMPKNSQYEFLNRSRICKALLSGPGARQQALAVRLLAIANLAYIHPEFVFLEQVLKQDNDEPRRYHLVYQLVELIHPSTPGQTAAPRWLQQIALSLLEAISHFNAKYQDVISALNATVNHGVLLYVIRKAVAEMQEETEQPNGKSVELDDWRDSLFSLALHLAMNGRVGGEMINAGFMDVLVNIINMRTTVAERLHSTAVSYVDALVLNFAPAAFNSFISASGLDAIAQLMIDATSSAKSLAEAGHGTKPEFYSSVVDYEIPYAQQQTLKWLLKFIHHIMNPSAIAQNTNTDRLLRNLVDNSKLLGSLRTIMENTKAFGSVVWTNSINLLTDFINNDPTSFAAISETGMVKSLLESLTGREISTDPAAERRPDEQLSDENGPHAEESVVLPADERPHPPSQETLRAPRPAPLACGILPSSEATAVIIPVINSICLNNVGLRLVASSRVLESFLEVFESPEHVRIMGIDADLAYNVGLQFDELARHHPALRQTVANAVIDMIARIKDLGMLKAETAGWGAKLFVTDLEGKVVHADHSLLQKAGVEMPSKKGKEAATSTEDVDMTDVVSISQGPSSQQSDSSPGPKTPDTITPYINALASFLNAYISNSSLRTSLTKSGGIEYLLDIMVLPSLPHEFADSTALGLLQQVLANIIEHAPVVGMPSLLNRIRSTMSSLVPLLSSTPSPSFFRPFVEPGCTLGQNEAGGWNVDLVRQVSSGTDVAKALLNVQSLLKTLWSCFPYQSRHSSVSLPPVNVYDHFHEVVRSLGPLLRVVLSEEISLITLVPQHWTARKLANVRPGSSSELLLGDQDITITQMLGGAGLNLPADQLDSTRQNRPSTEEQSTAQYQNYQILRVLLQSLMPSAYSFFQTLGKALMTRRERDSYARSKHMQLADALADTVLDQLEPFIDRSLTKSELQYCIIMLHIIHEMLVDSTRHSDRPGSSVIVPVLDAFKQRRGFDILNKLINVFAEEVTKDHAETEEASATAKLASIGARKILDLYSVVVNGKNLADSIQHLNVGSRSSSNRQNEWFQTINQFVVEVRMSVLPTVSSLWRSNLIDKASTDVVGKVVDILKTICQAETEGSALRRSELSKAVPLFKREQATFPWNIHMPPTSRLTDEYPEELAQEAVYRALGAQDNASEYCRMHQRGLAGERNPIPPDDAFQVTSPAENGSTSQTPAPSRSSDLLRESMVVDNQPGLPQVPGSELGDHAVVSNSREAEAPAHQDDGGSSSTPVAAPPTAAATSSDNTEQELTDQPAVCKEDLDAERKKLGEDLIDRCLDVIRAHPNSVFEVSELISVTTDRQDSEDTRKDVGETLVNALMSYALDDEEKTTNGRSIAAYAHLLSLMLHGSPRFFKSTVETLKDNVSEYLGFLKVPPGNSNEELPPWIPHILLIFEMLLADDAQPVEAKWTPPATENDKIEQAVLQAKEPIIPEAERATLLESVLEILPRIGKNEDLAVAVLRVLVILTRKRSVAKLVGDRRNLQRLFVMTKQLSGLGSARLKDSTVSGNVMTVLRHVVEDDDTLRQIMRSEVRRYFEQMGHRNPRAIDIPTYTRSLAHVALRSPDIFIEITNETVRLLRFQTPSDPSGPTARGVTLTLKDKPVEKSPASVPVSESVEPAVQATEELTINDVKPTTEPADKEMTDVVKSSAAESKRPVVENPDGVIHFLLCELLNYREVADKEPTDTVKETNTSGDDTGATTSEATPAEEQNAENKDKKAPKASFKAEEHPIFVYRCFLLHCLAELLQSYTSKKMEFINFKRNAPMFANTPVKPRSGVLNYLLNDLLCTSSLSSPQDSVAAKKKAATSEQARQVLVALVAKTNERPVDRSRDRFDYDDDSDLLFVRKWVLDMILRAYKDASLPSEPFDVRYAKLLSLAELMINMMGDKADSASPRFSDHSTASRSHMQLKRLMYEKSFLPALTSSIADIDLTFPGVKRTIKYILRVLQIMTSTGIALSHANLLPSGPQDNIEDDVVSASSLSDLEDDREETPDLYRNSALGMLEAGREDDFDEDSDDEDEEMYDDEEYPDELDYGDEMSQDGEEDVSDDDEELGEMGNIEGLPGDPVGVEVIMDEDDDDDDDDDDDEDMDEDELSDDDDDGDDDEVGSEDMDDIEEDDRIEIVDEEGNPLDDDDGSGWESETDDEDDGDEDGDGQAYEDGVHDLDELANMPNPLHELQELMQDDHADGHHHHHHHILAEEGFNFGGDRYDEEPEDDDEEDEQVDVEDDYIYDYARPGDEIAPPPMPAGLGWDALVVERGPPRPRRSPFPVGPFVIGGGPRGGDPLGDFRSYFRSRAPGPAANQDDGLNPLLRRGANNARDASPRPLGSPLQRFGGLHSFLDSPMSILSDLMANLPPGIAGRTPHLSFQIQGPGGRGEIQEFSIPLRAGQHSRDVRTETRREVYQEPQQAVGFAPATTESRWLDEARQVFGHMNQEKATRLNMHIWATLTPYAAEHERKVKAEEAERRRKEEEERQKRHEEERKAREAKEAEEKLAREKAEVEERERLERIAAEAAEAQAGTAETDEPSGEGSEDFEPQPMEGVETADDSRQHEREEPGPPQPRVLTTIRGEEVDVTELGIDPEYLAAIPEDLREEVIAQTVTSRRTEARAAAADSSAGEQGEVFQEFLDALPEDIRHEIVQAERHERRRAEREAQRRQTATIGHTPAAQDMDAASILATLTPDLRQTVLMEQGNEIMDQLPPALAEEARALAERYHRTTSTTAMLRTRDAARNAPEPATGNDNKVQRRAIVQMLDKAGVATLLRLMFVSQQGSIRSHLFRVLGDICENRQNRFEVIGSLLQILQFGSTDMEAVERSFSSLSLKAKQPKDKEKEREFKTPQSLKRTFTNISSTTSIQQNSEISPLLVVQQCLDLLVELSGRNPHIPSLFLTEHEGIAVSLKQAHNRKGKNKDLKVHKYAINSLLHLLDRDLVMESSTVMQLLVDLLNKVTLPLQALERRRKEAEEEARKEAEKAKEGAAQAEGAASTTDTSQVSSAAPAEAATEAAPKPADDTADKAQPEQKKVRQLQPPFIPPENLKLVVKIFVARECSSKTFQNTISTIKNLSNIPEAKQAFGRELVKQAQLLSKNIVSELDELMPHISKAESGTEIQGLALAKFSPGASEQNKLLRVLTALDHLFETKKDETRDAGNAAAADEKSSLLMTLYHNETFNKMWERLSGCLAAIRQRDSMLNVATILLPLIESLMVVCKNTTLADGPQSKSQFNKDMVLSSPPPEDAMAGLFFTFTNEHRRILNELVRQNNKLMSGTFSLLVKNPKVLEFDNKRSYFSRTVHAKQSGHTRPSYPPLSVNVRRDNVFHDSYRALAFKSDDEVKHGKLNVRFHGEEGVDAGGVTREWFQVLTRAMFNPDYILFTPVSADRTTFHPNKSSHYNEEHLAFFKFIGRIIGKAVYEGRLLDCYFSRAVYKRILGKPVSVKDMESFDPDYYKSLVWMLENDITGTVIESFSVEEDEFGASKVVDLIEDGRNIEVTNENKHEYVRLIVEHKLLSSVKIQMEHFLQGFHGVIPADLIAIFNEQELELLISGLPDIDVDDWKSNTEYHNYTAASQQIQWFWRAVRSFDKEEQAKLLQFVTGTSKVPLNGFKELEGMNGVNRFNIHRDYGNKDRLPSSHTCFNQLDLPEYESYEALRSQVIKAITTGGDYFGFA